MTCRNCFHYDVCYLASPESDPNACKKFITHDDVLCGEALEVLRADYRELEAYNNELYTNLNICEANYEELHREVKLLRIIKQTLEMQSGMNFDI